MENKKVDLYQYEKELYRQGITYIGGVDEVGRGPLIGPVVTACCVLPHDFKLEGLTDSKKLSEKKREEYYDYIVKHCICYGIGSVAPERIDEINIYEATKEAMKEAILNVQQQVPLGHVLIDAMPLELDLPHTSIIKGDAKSISIAAASVLAKVTRDRMLIELDKKYPMYGFASHKGYPTKKHIEAIYQYGLIDGYRKTYGPISDYLGLEYVDLVDENGKPTGRIIEKKELKKNGGNVLGVQIWIINEKDEILITHDDTVKTKGNKWSESTCGMIRTKESKNAGIKRMLKEKLNIEPNIKSLKKICTEKINENPITYFYDVYVLFLPCETKIEETSNITYVSLKQFKKMVENGEIKMYDYIPLLLKKLGEENERLFN